MEVDAVAMEAVAAVESSQKEVSVAGVGGGSVKGNRGPNLMMVNEERALNPLGAARLTFEEAVASLLPPAAGDPAAAFNDKDWGAVDLFNSFLFEQNGIPNSEGATSMPRLRRNASADMSSLMSQCSPESEDMSSINMPFSGSPSDASSDAAVPVKDDLNIYFQAPPYDRRINTGLPGIASTTSPVEDVINGTMAGGKMDRTASMQRVESLEHLQKRICGTPGSCGSGHWESAGWDPEISANKKHNQEEHPSEDIQV